VTDVSLAPGPGYSGPKRSLILAGGGMRVAYQAGAIRALHEQGLRFFHGDGASGGSMNLSMLLSGLTPTEMCDRWRALDPKKFVSYMPLKKYLDVANLPALGTNDGIINYVFPHLGIDVGRIRKATGMVGSYNVCNFTRKRAEVFMNDQIDIELLTAAISLPIFSPAVKRGDYEYLDAVWIKDANLMHAVERGADELWLIWCIGNSPKYHGGPFEQYVHMIEMSANGNLFEEFDEINAINRRIEKGEPVLGRTTPIRMHLIKPSIPLPLDPELYFGLTTDESLIDFGYSDASHYLATMTKEGVPMTPEATTMSEPTTGITFRETMSGGFAMGATDPVAGEKQGDKDGTRFYMHGTINVRDVDRFISDPEHAGEIVGSVDTPTLGKGLPSTKGVFNLFSPSDDPKMKYMVYELGFVGSDGKDYYMAGKKHVRDDHGLDFWRDVTTLFTYLHAGTDSTGPVVGAGTLSLSLNELRKLAGTMHATNAKNAIAGAETIGKFGKFFLGEMWTTYIEHK
jgi:predicted acylesterase/phospholipase RssA